MNEEALRIALSAPEAWETLTDAQTEALRALIEHGTVAGSARALKVTRQAVYDRLRHAERSLLAFARAIQEAGAA